MKLEQISVFLENRAGQLAELIHALAEEGIDILGLSLADTSDFGILRLVVLDGRRAIEALMRRGFATGKTAVLAVALKNEAGALDSLLALLSKAGVNVEYMYGCSSSQPGQAAMIFRFDKTDEALRLLPAHGFKLLSLEELGA